MKKGIDYWYFEDYDGEEKQMMIIGSRRLCIVQFYVPSSNTVNFWWHQKAVELSFLYS